MPMPPYNPEVRHSVATQSGMRVSLLNPAPQSIRIEDISHHLSRIARFTGATHGNAILSVGQHTLWVSRYLELTDASAALQLHGLLHDAAEAYLGDLSTPLKTIPAIGRAYRPLEQQMQAVIYEALGIRGPDREEQIRIKQADEQAAASEILQWMSSHDGQPTARTAINAVSARTNRLQAFAADHGPRRISALWLERYHRLARAISGPGSENR